MALSCTDFSPTVIVWSASRSDRWLSRIRTAPSSSSSPVFHTCMQTQKAQHFMPTHQNVNFGQIFFFDCEALRLWFDARRRVRRASWGMLPMSRQDNLRLSGKFARCDYAYTQPSIQAWMCACIRGGLGALVSETSDSLLPTRALASDVWPETIDAIIPMCKMGKTWTKIGHSNAYQGEKMTFRTCTPTRPQSVHTEPHAWQICAEWGSLLVCMRARFAWQCKAAPTIISHHTV